MSVAEFLRAARTPRMIGMFLLLVVAALVCIRLGIWQFDRAAVRGADQALTQHEEKIAADPVPLDQVLTTGQGFTTELQATHVRVTGHYETDHRLLAVDRSVDGSPAVYVIEPLRLEGGGQDGAVLAVVRGWLPRHAVDLSGAQPAQVDDPALDPPSGTVEITGHLAGSEPATSQVGAVPGVVQSLSPAQLTGLWGGPGFNAYLVLDEADVPELSTVPPPRIAQDTGMNLRNLLYALEWLVFGGFAIALWFRMVRDQVRSEREDALLATRAQDEELPAG